MFRLSFYIRSSNFKLFKYLVREYKILINLREEFKRNKFFIILEERIMNVEMCDFIWIFK